MPLAVQQAPSASLLSARCSLSPRASPLLAVQQAPSASFFRLVAHFRRGLPHLQHVIRFRCLPLCFCFTLRFRLRLYFRCTCRPIRIYVVFGVVVILSLFTLRFRLRLNFRFTCRPIRIYFVFGLVLADIVDVVAIFVANFVLVVWPRVLLVPAVVVGLCLFPFVLRRGPCWLFL